MLHLATANGWVLHNVNAKRAVLKFELSSGRTQTLYAIDLGAVVELSVPSALVYDTVDDARRKLRKHLQEQGLSVDALLGEER